MCGFCINYKSKYSQKQYMLVKSLEFWSKFLLIYLFILRRGANQTIKRANIYICVKFVRLGKENIFCDNEHSEHLPGEILSMSLSPSSDRWREDISRGRLGEK